MHPPVWHDDESSLGNTANNGVALRSSRRLANSDGVKSIASPTWKSRSTDSSAQLWMTTTDLGDLIG